MNAQHNKETIQAVYAAFGQGDVLSILEKLTDEQFHDPALAEAFR